MVSKFEFLLILGIVVPTVAHAESHSMMMQLMSLTPGMVDGRPAKDDENKEVLHFLEQDGPRNKLRNLGGKCSGIALGRCIITVGHCFDKTGDDGKPRRDLPIKVRGVGGYVGEIDKDKIAQFKEKKERDDLRSEDLAIARLDSTPPNRIGIDDLAKADDVTFPAYPATFKKEDLRTYGLAGVLGGYGREFDQVVAEYEKWKVDYDKRGGAQLGELFRIHNELAYPKRQIGDVRVMGPIWETLGHTTDEEKKRTSLMMLPSPSRPHPGDSGGALWHTTRGGKRVLLGLIASGILNPKNAQRFLAGDRWKDVVDHYPSFATSVIERRKWIEDKFKDLGCEVPATTSTMDSMPKR